MIIKYAFNIEPFPKPRGGVGKYGNMTHSSKGYRQWQERFKISLYGSRHPFPSKFHGLVFFFYIKPKPGQPPDLENYQGAIQDTLVLLDLMEDDNYKILGRYHTDHIVVKEPSHFDLYVVSNRKEMLHVINLLPEMD
ncbi:RusA [Nostoc phage N1]|nr:RusA [Nostoc phage N1]